MQQSTSCKVFGNLDRQKLIVCLEQAQNVSTLLTKCELSQSALSQHLKVLREAGIVSTVRYGKEIHYRTKHNTALKIAKLLLKFEHAFKSK